MSGATLKDVARVAGVHPGTVSRALNTETRSLVNEGTAQRVLRAAEELGYRPNPIARGLKMNRSYTVGVLVPDLTNPLFPPIVRGIQDRLEEDGYTPLVANTENDIVRERADFETLRARQVEGVITATARLDEEFMDEIDELGLPVVLVNRRVADDALPAVTGDDREGVRLAVTHLVDLGHRHIGHLGGPQSVSTGLLRHRAFGEVVRDLGIEADPGLARTSNAFTEAEGERLCHQLLDETPEVTAVVTGNDLMALGCFDVLAERGFECPRDLSVVGFNDMPFAGRFRPSLTSVRIPHYEMGVRAASLLLTLLADPDAAPPQSLVAPELVVRRSTAPPRDAPTSEA